MWKLMQERAEQGEKERSDTVQESAPKPHRRESILSSSSLTSVRSAKLDLIEKRQSVHLDRENSKKVSFERAADVPPSESEDDSHETPTIKFSQRTVYSSLKTTDAAALQDESSSANGNAETVQEKVAGKGDDARNGEDAGEILDGEEEEAMTEEDAAERQIQMRWRLICVLRMMYPSQKIVQVARQLGRKRITSEAQATILECLTDETFKKSPLGSAYCARVLKLVIMGAEADLCEVSDELHEEHYKYIVSPQTDSGVIQSDLNQPITLEWYHKTYAYLPLKPQDAVMQADTPEKVLRYGLRKPRVHKRQSKSLPGSPCSPWNTGLPTSVAADSATISMRTSPNFFSGGTGCHEWDAGFFLGEIALSWPGLFGGRSVLELGAGAGLAAVAMSRAPTPP
eukprot:CAMPEP_0198222214 /NCGR_PEP_ID=MMETSP1445-20131203/87095_1 /TAXON_ID=36898 /ORGANISM="Pyramimonas sp., Strain CCMP2087" /LENGTH=398 /DNA_ID=CAMNT_0043900641 /DNA_START=148 /DNA_END=1341 /DNA_ORIENTATION=+